MGKTRLFLFFAKVAAALVVVGGLVFFQWQAAYLPRAPIIDKIDTDTPIIARLIIAGGDPYLASNYATFRSLIANLGHLDAASLDLLAKIQDDASRLNPANADNFYIAQGTLPWITHDHRLTETTNRILERASKARRVDFMPDFFLGINAWYFGPDYFRAGQHFRAAGDKVPPPVKEQLYGISASYHDKGDNVQAAKKILRHLQSEMANPKERQLIELRISRLDGLEILQKAAQAFLQSKKRPPKNLDELVDAGLIDKIPTDPLLLGYRLDATGIPRLVAKPPPLPR